MEECKINEQCISLLTCCGIKQEVHFAESSPSMSANYAVTLMLAGFLREQCSGRFIAAGVEVDH